jgi:hypothetical protein
VRITTPEFRDQFAAPYYPFVDTARLTSTTGLKIDPAVFLDASLYPPGWERFLYLAAIRIDGTRVSIELQDGLNRSLATTVFDSLQPPEILTFRDGSARIAGVLVADVNLLSLFGTWPPGTHTFQPQQTTFVVSVAIPTPDIGVRGIEIGGDILAGDVWLVGDHVVLRTDGPDTIRMDLVGDPLFRRRLCDPIEQFDTPRFIRTVNGCPPDQNGNYNLNTGNHETDKPALRVYPTDRGLTVEGVGQRLTD